MTRRTSFLLVLALAAASTGGCSGYFGAPPTPSHAEGAITGLLEAGSENGSARYVGSVAIGADSVFAVVSPSNGSGAMSLWEAPRLPGGASAARVRFTWEPSAASGLAPRIARTGDTVYWTEPTDFDSACIVRALGALDVAPRSVATVRQPNSGPCQPFVLVASGAEFVLGVVGNGAPMDPFNPYGGGQQNNVSIGSLFLVTDSGSVEPLATNRSVVARAESPLVFDGKDAYWLEDTVVPGTVSERDGGALVGATVGNAVGSVPRVLVSFPSAESPLALAADATDLYFSTSLSADQGGTARGCLIRRVPKSGGAPQELLRDDGVLCSSLSVDAEDVYFTNTSKNQQIGDRAPALGRISKDGATRGTVDFSRSDATVRSIVVDDAPAAIVVDVERVLSVDKSAFSATAALTK